MSRRCFSEPPSRKNSSLRTITYSPTGGYVGPDTFSYQALGINNDGSRALDSGDVTVQVTVALSGWCGL